METEKQQAIRLQLKTERHAWRRLCVEGRSIPTIAKIRIWGEELVLLRQAQKEDGNEGVLDGLGIRSEYGEFATID